MLKKSLLVATLLVAFGAAQAAEPKSHGAYIGGGIGTSLFDDGDAFAGFLRDDSDSSKMLFAGVKVFKYLAIEGRYSDFGTFSIDGAAFDVSALSAHLVGTVPFGDSGWELYGQLGLGTLEFDAGFGIDDDQSAAAGGIGLRYSPSPNISLGIQADAFVWEDDLLGPAYDLGIIGTSLTARIIF
jgi:opacity protein-like surface antigen